MSFHIWGGGGGGGAILSHASLRNVSSTPQVMSLLTFFYSRSAIVLFVAFFLLLCVCVCVQLRYLAAVALPLLHSYGFILLSFHFPCTIVY